MFGGFGFWLRLFGLFVLWFCVFCDLIGLLLGGFCLCLFVWVVCFDLLVWFVCWVGFDCCFVFGLVMVWHF